MSPDPLQSMGDGQITNSEFCRGFSVIGNNDFCRGFSVIGNNDICRGFSVIGNRNFQGSMAHNRAGRVESLGSLEPISCDLRETCQVHLDSLVHATVDETWWERADSTYDSSNVQVVCSLNNDLCVPLKNCPDAKCESFSVTTHTRMAFLGQQGKYIVKGGTCTDDSLHWDRALSANLDAYDAGWFAWGLETVDAEEKIIPWQDTYTDDSESFSSCVESSTSPTHESHQAVAPLVAGPFVDCPSPPPPPFSPKISNEPATTTIASPPQTNEDGQEADMVSEESDEWEPRKRSRHAAIRRSSARTRSKQLASNRSAPTSGQATTSSRGSPKEGLQRTRRVNRPEHNHSKEAKAILREWFCSHIDQPGGTYPSDKVKDELALRTSLTRLQITNFFINERKRSNIWKQSLV